MNYMYAVPRGACIVHRDASGANIQGTWGKGARRVGAKYYAREQDGRGGYVYYYSKEQFDAAHANKRETKQRKIGVEAGRNELKNKGINKPTSAERKAQKLGVDTISGAATSKPYSTDQSFGARAERFARNIQNQGTRALYGASRFAKAGAKLATEVWNNTKSTVSGAIETGKNFFVGLFNSAKSFVQDTWESAKLGATKMLNNGRRMVDNLLITAGSAMGKDSNIGNYLSNTGKAGISSADASDARAQAAYDTYKGDPNNQANLYNLRANQLDQQAAMYRNSARQNLDSAAQNVRDTVANAYTGAKNAVTGAYDSIKNAVEQRPSQPVNIPTGQSPNLTQEQSEQNYGTPGIRTSNPELPEISTSDLTPAGLTGDGFPRNNQFGQLMNDFRTGQVAPPKMYGAQKTIQFPSGQAISLNAYQGWRDEMQARIRDAAESGNVGLANIMLQQIADMDKQYNAAVGY